MNTHCPTPSGLCPGRYLGGVPAQSPALRPYLMNVELLHTAGGVLCRALTLTTLALVVIVTLVTYLTLCPCVTGLRMGLH